VSVLNSRPKTQDLTPLTSLFDLFVIMHDAAML
jgi:hypothetical protein